MDKRGVESGEVIKYILIAIIIIAILFFGFKAISSVFAKACDAELAQFEIKLQELGRNVKAGSVEEKDLLIPCGAEQIMFFDLEKDLDPRILDRYPLVKDSVISKAQKNVFLIKDGDIFGSVWAGPLEAPYPNYVCMIPRVEKINFFLEGKGRKVKIIPGCLQAECTYYPSEPSFVDAAMIIDEAVEFGISNPADCPNCPSNVQDEFDSYVQTKENAQVIRKYEQCREDGKTNIEIIVRPHDGVVLEDVRIYESIPKECVDDLRNFLTEYTQGEVSIKFDPLIVWSLDEVKEEARLSYVLDTFLVEECREVVESMGIAEVIDNGVTAAPVPLPAYCGDNVCNAGETCSTCAVDCGACPPPVAPTVTPPVNICASVTACSGYTAQSDCDGDVCSIATSPVTCTWFNNACIENVVSSCSVYPSQLACVEDFGRVGDCNWQATTNTCIAGACTSICTSPENRCEPSVSDTAFRSCGDFDSDACEEWSAVQHCGAGDICQNGVCVATAPATNPPGSPSLSGVHMTVSPTWNQLSWNSVSGADSYTVRYCPGSCTVSLSSAAVSGCSGTTGTRCDHFGILSGSTHTYRVFASNANGDTGSNSVQVTAGAAPPTCTPSCGTCGGYSSTCDETGTRTCTNSDCSTSIQYCTRNTDGLSCPGGTCSNGVCQAPTCTPSCGACSYSSTCDETGTKTCTNSDCSISPQPCSRNTDGLTCGSGMVCSAGSCVPEVGF